MFYFSGVLKIALRSVVLAVFGPGSPAHRPDISSLFHLGQNWPWNCLSGKVTSLCQVNFMDQKRTEQEKRKEKKKKKRKVFVESPPPSTYCSRYILWNSVRWTAVCVIGLCSFLLNRPAAAAERPPPTTVQPVSRGPPRPRLSLMDAALGKLHCVTSLSRTENQ